MHTALRRRCQTACAAALLTFGGIALADPPPSPPWQAELNAARLLALAVGPQRPAEVAKAFADLAAKYPDQLEVQRACGDQAWSVEQPDAAVRYWQRAQQLAPADPGAADSLGSAYLRLGRIRDAAAQFERAVAGAPDNPLYHFDLANVLALFRHELGDNPAADNGEGTLVRALGEFRRAAELAIADRRLAQAYAETYYMLAKPDWQAALTAWLAVRALSGEATDFANIHLARVSLKLGRAAEARSYLEQLKDPAFTPLGELLKGRADTLSAAESQRNSSASPSR